uniref:CCR4-NOT transcription complex subunit 1 n=1 Tax=Timema douglasi TaxID=61478 RepID=A0A7R8VGG9_TIMDO|nr:unnamed protein product [Timema douglasi]
MCIVGEECRSGCRRLMDWDYPPEDNTYSINFKPATFDRLAVLTGGNSIMLVTSYGLEADRHLLRCLFSHIDFSAEGSKTSSSKDYYQIQLLAQESCALLTKPALISNLCYAIDNPLHHQKTLKPSPQLFLHLSKVLKLTPVQEVVFGLALLQSSNPDTQTLATHFVKSRLPELIVSYIETESSSTQQEGGLHDATPEVLHLILSNLLHGNKDHFGISSETKEAFLKSVRRDFPRELVPVVLAPLLYPSNSDLPMDKLNQDTTAMSNTVHDSSLADLIAEVGYGFCSSLDECRNTLVGLMGGRDISAGMVARVLSMMARTHSGLEEQVALQSLQTTSSFWEQPSNKDKNTSDTNHATAWAIDVFVQVLKEQVPNLVWNDVVLELDHPEFILKDRSSLNLLMSALRLGFQGQGFHPEMFPVDLIYRHWKTVEGQFSLIQQILKNPDVFCFADYPFHSVTVDILKAPPESDNKEITTWRSLDLVETLLYLADRGLYAQVQEMFKFPLQHCPDVLVLALLHINPPVTVLRQELLSNLIPIFLGNHLNSAIIFHHAWHSQGVNIKPIIMHAMADWYSRGDNDQTRLSRILDVAQDLKRRCPQIMGSIVKEENLPKSAQLPHETLTTMLACLQVCAGNVSQELSEAILTMVANCSILLSKPRQPPPGVMRPHRNIEQAFNPSSIGGQLFSAPQVDSIANIGSTLANINLGAASTGSAFNLPATLGPLVSTPGSPSRLMNQGPSQSPFPMIMSSQLPHTGPVGTQVPGSTATSLVPGVGTMGARIGPQPGIDKRLGETSSLFPEMSQNVSKEIEDEANSYFQRIYNHPPHPTLSIDEVLEMLKKFQDSPNKREREVFNCMLRNLFEEYRFFPQYPDKELHITAQLFGGIIERGLVSSYMALGLALRFVLDALRKPNSTKMYYFGIAALDRFKSRLKDYQKYCEHVAAIQHFNEFPPHLIEYVEYGLQSQEPPNRPQGNVLPASLQNMLNPAPPATTSYKTMSSTTITTTTTTATKPSTTAQPPISARHSIANATNIDTLLVATEKEEKMTAPPEALQDKIGFVFNNLSQLNLQTKVLLRSDKGIANFSDRSLLKNLGHWLGMLTLAKSRPILQVDIDLKALLAEAYHKGQQELLYVVPFVAKVLESCAKSKPCQIVDKSLREGCRLLEEAEVFKPPNPWTMSIMSVLAALHHLSDLKLNLKFEIEVLCKNLNIDVTELKPSPYLKDQEKLRNLDYQLSHPNKKPEAKVIPAVSPSPVKQQPSEEMSQIAIPSPTPAAVVASINTTPTSNLPAGPPEPRFSFMDINTATMTGINPHISINNQLPLLQAHPHLKQFVRQAVERAITEWIHPVVDRAIKIALTTCEQIVKKDFALDSDESRIRAAAHHMVRNLTAGMAMITCRDQVNLSISANLKTTFMSALMSASHQHKDMVEQTATHIAQDNMELACAFIQKTAIEKAIPEIDKRLLTDFELRKHARTEGRRYCDPQVLTYQAERMPEQIRLKVGGVSPHQMVVYEEFARNIPGFLPLNERDAAMFIPKPVNTYGTDEIGSMYDKLINELELYLQSVLGSQGVMSSNCLVGNLHSFHEALLVARRSRDVMSAATLLQKAVEGLLDGLTPVANDQDLMARYRDIHLRVLKALQDPRAYGMQWTNKQVTRCLIESREEFRYNLEAIDCLIRSHLVNLQQYDMHVSHSMDGGLNFMAVAFGMQLVQLYLIEERLNSVVTENDLYNTIEMLARIASHSRNPPEGLTHLIDALRANHDPAVLVDRAQGGPSAHIHSGILQVRARDFDDPPGLMEKTEYLLRDWVSIYHSPSHSREPTRAFSLFVQQLNGHGILKTDDLITRFFRMSTQMCVDLCYRALAEQTVTPTLVRAKCFHTLDAFVRLIALLVKHSGDSSNTGTKINLLNKVLGIVAGVLMQDHDNRLAEFQQLPYHRVFIMLFLELNAPEAILEAINYQVLTAFCHTLHILRPSKSPGFAYAWLELVSHRVFIGRMLAVTPQQKGWGMYAQLLIDLFKFLAPFLRNAELAKPVTLLYKGTLRVLLVLLHDFPEFLCDYHYGFCDVIPPNCIQMRNLILSAFPRNMRLPDPFTPNLKVDMLPEIAHAPRVLTNFASMIQPLGFKKDLDSYLKARAPVTFLSELRSSLQVSNEPGMRYNIPLMNALVLYVGTQAINFIRSKGLTPTMTTIAHSSHMDIFQNLAVDLDTEGRYLFLNAIANQLRYPNSHTHYFSCTLLYLFAEANTEAIQEQITRVLLERLIVNRPHPWGLLITFIELIKNPTYKFWNHEFVHCAPEIEKLFESVARSCMVQKQVQPVQENDLAE